MNFVKVAERAGVLGSETCHTLGQIAMRDEAEKHGKVRGRRLRRSVDVLS